jgi:signal transduction histidine kinase
MPVPSPLDPQLLSLVVHEFRTPITIVAGYLRMMLRDSSNPLGDGHRRMVEEAERSCGRLAALVAELSDLTNLIAATAAFNRHDLNLFSILDEAVAQLASTTDLPIVAGGTDEEAIVKGDAVRLRQALVATLTALRREMLPDDRLVVERQIYKAGKKRNAIIAAGTDAVVRRLLASPSRGIGPFNVWRGGAGLALVIAEQVINAHGGKLAAPQPAAVTQPGAAIILPVRS